MSILLLDGSIPEIPNKFGGVSAGGLWHFDVVRYPTGEFEPARFHLFGVAFYQLPESEPDIVTIRHYGPRSIYEAFLPIIRRHISSDGLLWLRGWFECSHVRRSNIIIESALSGIALNELAALLAYVDFNALESGLGQPAFELGDQLRTGEAAGISSNVILKMIGQRLQSYHVRNS
jgi:hypothetical protein